MDQSRFIAQHVINLPKSGIRDFFDIVARMKDAISLGVIFKTIAASNPLH
jgi:aminotransferase